MKNVPAMGQKRDRHNRERLARQDNDARQKQVSTARKFIYEKKYAVTAEVVEAQLSDGSIVPSKVSPLVLASFLALIVNEHTERLLPQTFCPWLRSVSHARCGFYA